MTGQGFSVLIGGKAGDGIDQAGDLIAHILNELGYRVFVYRDYPSIIRGGHTFSIIRASKERIYSHINQVNALVALNQETVDLHKDRLAKDGLVIFEQDQRNTYLLGALFKALGIEWPLIEKVFSRQLKKELEANLEIARRGYDAAAEKTRLEPLAQSLLPLFTGNEAIGRGLVKAGLKAYVAYPMTPSSALLHFLAQKAEEFSLKVVHPESEIAVILMALGFAYAGEKAAVGTSGGGFCLMTEGLSFAGMAELPIVIMVGQRPGPSTGLPTYTAQTELHFVINAGQGEFSRLVVAPGDAEEAYFWAGTALNLAWKCQAPAILLTDKTICESLYNFDLAAAGETKDEPPVLWDRKGDYQRYRLTESGVSPLAFPGQGEARVKVSSYEHDESGLTTEKADQAKKMQEKRLRKIETLEKELANFRTVNVLGKAGAETALLCWGSNKGVCREVADGLGLRLVQPVVLFPFPAQELKTALSGVKKVVCIENNATGQLARLLRQHGLAVDELVLKYDGRPFALDELEERVGGLIG